MLGEGNEALAKLDEARAAVIKYTYAEKVPGVLALREDPDGAAKWAASQVTLARTGVRTMATNLPEGIESMEEAREVVVEEGKLLGLSEEDSNAVFDEVLQEELDAEAEAEAQAQVGTRVGEEKEGRKELMT